MPSASAVAMGAMKGVIFVVSFLFLAHAAQAVSSCGYVNSSIVLTANISVNGTCFILNASGIVLDGSGFNITGQETGYGINNSAGFGNITIMNFAGIINFSVGIYASGMANSSISNNTIAGARISGGHGINVLSSNTTNISGNTINVTGGDAYGIYVQNSESLNISQNTVITSGTSGYALYFVNSEKTILDANTIHTSNANSYGLYLDITSGPNRNFNVSGNNITSSGSGAVGIYLNKLFFSLIYRNNITTFGNTAQPVYSDTSGFNNISSNILSSAGSGSDAIYMVDSSNYSIRENNMTTSGPSALGIYIDTSSGTNANMNVSGNTISTSGTSSDGIYALEYTGCTFSANTITTANKTSSGIYLSSSNLNTVSGNTFSSNYYGIFLDSASSYNNFTGNRVTSTNESAGYAVYLDNADSNLFDSDFLNSTYMPEFYANAVSDSNLIFNMSLQDGPVVSAIFFNGITLDNNITPPAGPANMRNLSSFLSVEWLTAVSYIEFNLSYADSAISSVNESTLGVYMYNETERNWSLLPNSTGDAEHNMLFAGNVSEFALFGIFGNASIEPPAPPPPTPPPAGQRSSGGGGFASIGVSSTSSSVSKFWDSISPGASSSMDISNEQIPVTEISFVVKDATGNAELRVKNISTLPKGTPSVQSPSYQYLEINSKGLESVQRGRIKFRVSSSWIEQNSAGKVSLYRYSSGWEELVTAFVSSRGDFSYYSAYTPGFSVFAIAKASSFCGDRICGYDESYLSCRADCIRPMECDEGELRCRESEQQECTNGSWIALEICQYGCNMSACALPDEPEITTEEIAAPSGHNASSGLDLIYVLIVCILAVLLAFLVVHLRKGHHHRRIMHRLHRHRK